MDACVTSAPPNNRTILIVDDDADAREALALVLETQGYESFQAENGREALEWLNASSTAPGLILLDLEMPVMGGRELLSKLQKLPVRPTAIVITGQDPRAIPGAAAVLRKPVAVAQLFGLMQRLAPLPEQNG